MKNKTTSMININRVFKESRSNHKYQIFEDYWKKRKKECEKNPSRFC